VTARTCHARRMRRVLVAALTLLLGAWEPFRTPDPDVTAGNEAYAEGRYDDAIAAYDRAGRRGGVDADGLAYDRGTAELKKAEAAKDPAEKQRLTEHALEALKQAARSHDPRVRGGASYNRGNTSRGPIVEENAHQRRAAGACRLRAANGPTSFRLQLTGYRSGRHPPSSGRSNDIKLPQQ